MQLKWRAGLIHGFLIAYSLIAVLPILLVVMNSFKIRKAIFGTPLALPSAETFSLVGYVKVLGNANIGIYFFNSLSVTLISMATVRRWLNVAAYWIPTRA